MDARGPRDRTADEGFDVGFEDLHTGHVTDMRPDWRSALAPRGLSVPGVLYLCYAEEGGPPVATDPANVPLPYRVVDPRTGETVREGVRATAGEPVPTRAVPHGCTSAMNRAGVDACACHTARLRAPPRAAGPRESAPRLTWRTVTDAADWRQAAHQVEITAADGTVVGDTGRVASTESLLVPWPGPRLGSRGGSPAAFGDLRRSGLRRSA
jgi:hypothetical protein